MQSDRKSNLYWLFPISLLVFPEPFKSGLFLVTSLLKMGKILENLVISSHGHIAFPCSWSLNSIMQVYSILLILAFTLGYSENIILVIKCFFLTHLGIKFHFPYSQDQVLPNLICFSFYLRMSSMSISVLRFYINCIYKLMTLKFTSLSQVFFQYFP